VTQQQIRLEPFAEHHLPAIPDLLADPDVQRFTRVPVPAPADFPRTWLGRYQQGRRDKTSEAFAIVDPGEAFCGLALAVSIDREAREAELGYVVAPAARGRGVATEALRLLTRWAFAELDALRLELLIGADNEPSKLVARRCGYVREGVLRSVHLKQGRRGDLEIWSRLATD